MDKGAEDREQFLPTDGSLTMSTDSSLQNFLGLVERQEARLLTWGIVDAGFTRDELEEMVLDAQVDDRVLADLTRGEVVDALVERRLMIRYTRDGSTFFRSRMAETVRLMLRLRQWFRGDDWRAAPPLVADMRFQIRPRMRPRLALDAMQVLERLAQNIDTGEVRRAGVGAYLALTKGETTRLRGFQYDGLVEILRALDQGGSSGVVVTAGTGSGKTNAFYLPAMVHVVEDIRKRPEHYLRCLALYPRQELLKDQLLTAVRAARRMGDSTSPAPRPVRVGAWFKAVPKDEADLRRKWTAGGGGFVCPYLPCPGCGGSLIWLPTGDAALTCRSCPTTLSHEEFALTRRHLQDAPADFLFTTTESLNRQLASSYSRSTFGLGTPHRPQLCLLDEVHTYDGTHGAHVANLIRRWRHAVAAPVVFTGLSATLMNAEQFFAELVGLPVSSVTRVEPAPEQMERTADEYLVALRHDATAGPQLLSLTIQTSMLLARMLDAPATGTSGGAFGEKVFVFTDRLDSVNAMFWSLCDAEGWYFPGRPVFRYTPRSLATLRAPDVGSVDVPKDVAGQTWTLAQHLGHDLAGDRQLNLGRTSSQDSGVEAGAQVVVATAALEVGFDDDTVGAVIQHKAPHDAARFLQRQGRAGRPSEMRPWTVLALGDNGKDRLAYQNYDRLFAPELEPRMLFVGNTYVLKMQALFATMDWLSQKHKGKGTTWADLSRPGAGPSRLTPRQKRTAEILREVLSGGWARGDLERHLVRALQLSRQELEAALWSAPRSLYLHALPTLLRRLDSAWGAKESGGHSDPTVNQLAPEFVPSQLYGELLVPEVRVVVPSHRGRGEGRTEVMPIEAALRELAPGNVTRRYAVADRTEMHWVPAAGSGETALDLTSRYVCMDDGLVEHDGQTLRCLRPSAATLVQTPQDVSEYNRAELEWKFVARARSLDKQMDPVSAPRWERLIASVSRHLHREAAQAEVRRFAPGATVTTVSRSGRAVSTLPFTDADGRPAAIGFHQEVDALRFKFRLPLSAAEQLLVQSEVLREHRWSYLVQRFDEADGFPPEVSIFSRHWLRIALVAALVGEWREGEQDLANAAERLSASFATALHGTLDAVFNVNQDHPQQPGRALQVLRDLLADPAVLAAVQERARVLWEVPDNRARYWLRRRLAVTMAGLVLQAAVAVNPQLELDDVTIDCEDDEQSDEVTVWLTETSPGSTGFIEQIVRAWQEDPRRLFDIVDAGGRSSDLELADKQLLAILDEALTPTSAVRAGFEDVRAAWIEGHAATAAATQSLRAALTDAGVRVRRAAFNTVASRLLAPGSSPDTDVLHRDFARYWDDLAVSVGVDLDSRAAAFRASEDSGWDDMSPRGSRSRNERYSDLNALLWARGPELERSAVELPSRYGSLPAPATRALAVLLGDDPVRAVDLRTEDWRRSADAALREDGVVHLLTAAGEPHRIREAVLDLALQATDCGYVLTYPRVEGIQALGGTLRLRVHVPEMR